MSDGDDGRDQRLGIEQYIDVNCNLSIIYYNLSYLKIP